MIFRGSDTTALLTEWVMAELVLNNDAQNKLHHELDFLVGNKNVTDADVAKLPFLQAVIKETLRLHPPGPLLSWARMSTSDVNLSNGMVVPANTTAMVNMWSVTHDPKVWEDPLVFKPERFLKSEGGADVDPRGGDLRLAPFGAGRRVCPGKNLGLVTVSLWVAKLVHQFKWVQDKANPVGLTEILKLSCEMKNPLFAVAVPRNGFAATQKNLGEE
jgi:cytochrome P450